MIFTKATLYTYFTIVFDILGSIIGQAFSDHPDIRKIGFTGSTEVGKGIMKR